MPDSGELLVEIESAVSYTATAQIANASFEHDMDWFSGDYLEWLYGSAFGGDTTIIAAKRDGRKIGQAVVLWHPLRIGGADRQCAQLIDLFVTPAHRSFEVVRKIYAGLSRCLEGRPNVPVITVPNLKATRLNKRFLKLESGESLAIRVGLVLPGLSSSAVRSCWFSTAQPEPSLELMQDCVGSGRGTEVAWTPRTMAHRLGNPHKTYAIHRSDRLCAITSFRSFRRFPAFLVCGLFVRGDHTATMRETSAILFSAARMHRCPTYLYIGVNREVALPGKAIPDRFRPSPMKLQTRFDRGTSSEFDRFETIDFDFA